jgi:subtilisin family serine protease
MGLFEPLEPRAMLSGDTATLTLGGTTVDVVKSSYVALAKPDADFSSLASKAGFTAVKSLGDVGGSGMFYSFTSDWSWTKVESWGKRNSRTVQAVQPDVVYAPAVVSNDPYFKYQWMAQNTGQLNPDPAVLAESELSDSVRQYGVTGADINLTKAWNITTGSSDVVVAVIDSGVDFTHPDLAPNRYINTGEIAGDGIDNDGNGYVDDYSGYNTEANNNDMTDIIGHGTAVASCISAAGDNGIGIAGVTWNTKILAVRVDSPISGRYPTSATIAAYDYVAKMKLRGVNIAAANLSFGGPREFFDPVDAAAINRLTSAGVVVVASAGNESVNNDRSIRFPQRATGLGTRTITVAATDNYDKLTRFSNYGARTVQVGAPGEQILMAASSTALSSNDPANTLLSGPGVYISGNGTSFSSPITAGIVALAKAAYPDATPDQLVDAVLRGVDVVKGLQGATPGSPNLVSTAGRVDAYNTLQIVRNRVGSQVTTLGGSWRGTYGSLGEFVYAGTNRTPTMPFLDSGATLTPTNSAVVGPIRINVNDPRLAQNSVGEGRSAYYLASDSTIDIPYNFGTSTRRLTVYAADLERRGRVQNVQIVDTDTGRVLQSVTLSKFQNGVYQSFDLTGRVTLRVQAVNGRGAVINALFVDPTPPVSSNLVGTDTLTRGNWMNTYGDVGYLLPGAENTLPSFFKVTTPNAQLTNPGVARNVLLPETAASLTDRSTGYYSSGSGVFDLNVNITDGTTRPVSFYIANTDSQARGQRLTLINPADGSVVSSVDVTVQARSGSYVTLNLSGNNTLRVSALGPDAPTINGIFINSSYQVGTSTPANQVKLVGVDAHTQGRWRGIYGNQVDTNNNNAAYLFGASSFFPNTLQTVTPTGGSTTILASATSDRRALTNPDLLSAGTEAYYQTQDSMQFDFAPVDSNGSIGRLSLYFADYDRKNRVQRVELIDPTTGKTLSSTLVRDFKNGKYLSWDVSKAVRVRITRVSGPSAVVSGVFFD